MVPTITLGELKDKLDAGEEVTLLELGYTNVRDYHEGKAEWVEAGLSTESGAAAKAA
jgi:rhodanese-related sulfurtransferase